MKKRKKFIDKKKIFTSNLSVIISMTIVLFLFGLISSLLLQSKIISKNIRENIKFSLILRDSSDSEVKLLINKLKLNKNIKSITFNSKDDAAAKLTSEINQDFIETIGYNPLPDVIDIKFFNTILIEKNTFEIINYLKSFNFVDEIIYNDILINTVKNNLNKVSYILLFTIILFTLISISLINSSIRLLIFSKRFLIKTMQLVGAKTNFIRKPFILNNIKNGIISSFFAIILINILIDYVLKYFSELNIFFDIKNKLTIFTIIICFGIIIPWVCTFLAVRKYLKLSTNDLYE
ncbi:MAG: FtsX-like permease family protein [Flavobacteriales bacterium TMED288]|nr:cell division protein FtsX [Flavobacteriales bacterium]RPG53855.1 MAG: FtsX-like permease family protein [Flavobacteriales bacterium TMED288]